jgi:hypothetical protein
VTVIPVRFRGECHYCHETVDIRQQGVSQWQEGWIEARTGGGAHAIRMPVKHMRFAHKWCIDSAIHKAEGAQLGLFT